VTRSTSPAISSVGTRGWEEEAVILIEVYAVEAHPCAVIQSGPAARRATWSPYIPCNLYGGATSDAALEVPTVLHVSSVA
jgi:hypothetical protein